MADSAPSPGADGATESKQKSFTHLIHAAADAHDEAAQHHHAAADAHADAAKNLHDAADAQEAYNEAAQAANEGTRAAANASAQRAAVNRVAANPRTSATFRAATGRR